jgi:branched-chain amino acid transport system substrate-binding protein
MERRRSRNVKKLLTNIAVCAVVVFLVVALVAATPSLSAAQQTAGPAKTLKVGYILCLSDWYSVFDSVENRYLNAAAKMINEKGGITVKGQKYNIELVGEDGKSTLDGVTAAATKLAYDQKVKFVVGPSAFFNTAVSPVFEPNKVLHVLGYYTAQPGELDETTPYAFLAYSASIGNTMAVIKAMRKMYPDAKKIVIATPDDGAVPYLIPKVKKMLEVVGCTPVGDVIRFPNQMEDFSPISAKINAVKEADATLIIHGAPAAFGLITKGLRALGNTKPITINAITSIEEIQAISGKEAANNLLTVAFSPLAKGNPPLIDELYKKAGSKPPMGINTASDLWVLAKMIQAANSLDPTVVKAKWESMDTVDTLFGKGMIGGDETYGIKHHVVSHPMSYQGIVNGKPVAGWLEVGRIP